MKYNRVFRHVLMLCLTLVTCLEYQEGTAPLEGDHPVRPESARPGWFDVRDVLERDDKGRIKMGEANPDCDDAVHNLEIDWNGNDTSTYTCDGDPGWDKTKSHRKELKERLKNKDCKTASLKDSNNVDSCFWVEEMSKANADWDCLKQNEIPVPDHICLNEAVVYDENPPRCGSHRPLWPVYGEYTYCPPQRWTHSLEHGAVVMLYDPCVVDHPILSEDLIALNRTVRDCLHRYVITPYKGMSQPFALITYGCRLMMDRVSEDLSALFISLNALRGPEHLADEGQYNLGLLYGAETVYGSDLMDHNLCPKWRNPAAGKASETGRKTSKDNQNQAGNQGTGVQEVDGASGEF